MISEIAPYNNYTGDGSTTQFDFDFLVENKNQLVVYHTNENNVQTTLVCDTDYSIHELNNNNGSYITFPLSGSSYNTLSANETLSLCLDLPIEQQSEYGTSSELDLKNIEDSFDYLTRIAQIQDRKIERAVKISEGSDIDTDELTRNINKVVDMESNISAVAENGTNINIVATDVSSLTSHIKTVSEDLLLGDNSKIKKTVDGMDNINIVSTDLSSNSSKINAVAEDLTDDSSNIKAVGEDLTDNNSYIKAAIPASTVATAAASAAADSASAALDYRNEALSAKNIAASCSASASASAYAASQSKSAASGYMDAAETYMASASASAAAAASAASSASSYASNASASANTALGYKDTAAALANSASASAGTAIQQANKAEQQANLARRYAQETHGASDVTFSNLRALPAINNYEYPQTDEDGLNSLIEGVHSTFDESKFTKSASWAGNITTDGIASGFSASNYLTTGISSQTVSTITLKGKFTTGNSLSGVACILTGSANYKFMLFRENDSFNIQIGDGSSWNYVPDTQIISSISTNTSYEYELNITSSQITGNMNGAAITPINVTGSPILNVGDLMYMIGARNWNASGYWDGSIDLKYFSIAVDGVPVFSGNQTGIDTIKADNYTVTSKTLYAYADSNLIAYANQPNNSGVTELYDKNGTKLTYNQSGDYYIYNYNGSEKHLGIESGAVVEYLPGGTMSTGYYPTGNITLRASITPDGVASGFSDIKYIKYTPSFVLSNTNSWQITSPVYTIPDITTARGSIFQIKVNIPTSNGIFMSTNNAGQFIIGIQNGTGNFVDVLRTTVSLSASTRTIQGKLTHDATTGVYTISYRLNGGEWVLGNSVTDTTSTFTTSGQNITFGMNATGCLMDINAFKIYINGDLVYQPCLKIPYTLSKTGSKIVDKSYRDRVYDMYEQFGYAPYFTLNENGIRYIESVIEKEGNPTLVNGVASNFSNDDYFTTLFDFRGSWELNCQFNVSEWDSNAALTLISVGTNLQHDYLIMTYSRIISERTNFIMPSDFSSSDDYLQTNTNYLLTIKYNGVDTYTTTVKNLDNNTIAVTKTVTSSLKFAKGANNYNTWQIGASTYDTSHIVPFNGSIDLNTLKVTHEIDYYQNFTVPQGNLYGMINPDNFDGEWVKKHIHLVQGSEVGNGHNVTLSLSSYLPNDKYDYEVLVSGVISTGLTDGDRAFLNIATDICGGVVGTELSPVILLCTCVKFSTTAVDGYRNASAVGSVNIPVGKERVIYCNTSSSFQNDKGTYSLQCLGYRRIGTNR